MRIDQPPDESTAGGDEGSVKSKAIVKHQIVRSPANFAQLQCNTDLNVPPTNWLNSSINSYGLQQALSQSTGFSSFRMAHLFPDCVGEVDVVANAENIKRLLKLPYTTNSSISMMVHRIGNTLLIDEFDVHKYLLQQEKGDWQWLRSFIYETILSRLSDPERNLFVKSTARAEATQQRSLLSKFLYHSVSRTEESAEAVPDVNEFNVVNPQFRLTGPVLPEPNIEENVPDPEHTKHTYNRNVVWTFEDIRMLIGTDMAIFGGHSRPCISLRLRDMRQPINVLTGIDYWLDNLMCNVPEVVMCYHLDGLVQNYEIIKTEDLPHLENSKFSPKVIRNVAQNILSFLKQNATKSGHTYWLFKGRNDDVVKLYDLSSLCTTGEFGGSEAPATKTNDAAETTEDSDNKNPFTVPVAMLLYKVARNMKNASDRMSAKQAGSIKALLENCVKLLPKEKYPQIVTSSYYLLSDLHVPTGIDPNAPNFDDDVESDTQSMYEDEKYSDDGFDVPQTSSSTSSIAVKNIYESASETKLDKNWKHNASPAPLSGSVEERCDIALQYIANGLGCLQYFSSTEEKLAKEREDIAKQQEKMRIIQEEQNPNMVRSYQAIPLPYEQLRRTSSDASQCVVAIPKEQRKSAKRNRSKSETVAPPKQSIGDAAKSMALKCQAGSIQSWNVHLKLLLLEKACLIYATLTERAYHNEQYGNALKFISLALKCQYIVTTNMSSTSSQKPCLLGRAGDCFFQCAQNFAANENHVKQFDDEREVDAAIKRELKNDIEGIDEQSKLPRPADNMEQLIVASIACYQTALDYATSKESRHELLGRLGSVRNELGVKYMHWAQTEYQKAMTGDETKVEAAGGDGGDGEDSTEDAKPMYLNLSSRSYDCLIRGIACFEEINDEANLAILLCNMGRFMRFRAHLDDSKENFNFKKKCYDSAFTHYQRALAILESKKRNCDLWAVVTWELSTGKFTLAKHMLEYFGSDMVSSDIGRFEKQKFENNFLSHFVRCAQTEDTEQEIIELMLGTLKLCDVETAGPRQIMYQIRSGLIYHNLGNIYCRAYWAETTSDVRKKKLLQLCRLYYEKGSKTFESIEAPLEYLAIQIDRIELQTILSEGRPNRVTL